MKVANAIAARARAVLERINGYPDFRCHQAENVEHVATGGDALVHMSTSGGKSIYTNPRTATARHGVVTPLIALMHDQVVLCGSWGLARPTSTPASVSRPCVG